MNRKDRTSEGFTLAELLIVVAIIGVLVAISIPIFTSRLERSREATDIANARSAYALVKTAAMTGDTEGDKVQVDGKGTYFVSVPLVQMEEKWQTASVNIGGIDESDAQHWREDPKPGGTCKVTCSAEGEVIFYWNGGFGYKPVSVSVSAQPYEKALNAVLSTVYNGIVADKLGNDTNHVSWVLIKNGQVTSAAYYKNAADMRGGNSVALTPEEKTSINADISKAMEGTNYTLANNATGYIFFDWDGNVVNNSGATKIGGQGTSASLVFFPEGSNQQNKLNNKAGDWSL